MMKTTPEVALPVSIRWHGRGGQGVVTGSRLLAAAALEVQLYPQSLPDFGAERSGAPVACYTRIGDSPPAVRDPIAEPDAVVVLDPSLLGMAEVSAGIAPGAALVVNTSRPPEELLDALGYQGITCCTVDGDEISARLLSRRLPNAPLLGALLHAVPVLDLATMTRVLVREMTATFSKAVVEGNSRALAEGYRRSLVVRPR